MINGQLLLSTALNTELVPKVSKISGATAGYPGFAGSITDFNAWSKALSHQEMQEFARGNLLLLENPPDVIFWETARISPRGNGCLQMITLDPFIIEQKNAYFQPFETFWFDPTFTSYANGQSDCYRINGHVLYPLNNEHLAWIEKHFANMWGNTFCPHTFGIPFKKQYSSNGSSEWWLVDGPTTQKAEFGPWPLNTSQSDGDCLYFDLDNRQYVQCKCEENLCVLCQLERNRLIFKLKSECSADWMKQVDQFYILSDNGPLERLGHINLIGEEGLTEFAFIKDIKVLRSIPGDSDQAVLRLKK